MAQYKSLLVATDFRDGSKEFCQQAILIAKNLQSEVTLLHAVEYIPYYPYYPYDAEKVHADLIEELSGKLNEVKKAFDEAGIKVNEHIIEEGNAYETICKKADSINACGIVIGVGEHHLLEKLIGSTASKVTHLAKQAVFLINPHSHIEGIKKIVCAYDFSENAEKALINAMHLAENHKAHLDVVHVVQEHFYFNPLAPVANPSSTMYKNHKEEMKNASKTVKDKLLKVIEKNHIEGVEYESHILEGDPVIEIFKNIEQKGSDLLVIGDSCHSKLVRFMLGSTSEKIIRKAPCSVMTVRSDKG